MLYYQMYYMDKGEMRYTRDLEILAENTRSMQIFLNLHLLNIDNKDAYMAASHMGRCAGLCDITRLMPYYFLKQATIIPDELLTKHATSYTMLWDQTTHGKLSEKFFDIVLEYESACKCIRIASYAKKHLEIARSFKEKLPAHAHRPLLIGIWCEYYLKQLEACNFNVFDPSLQKTSYLKLPKQINTAAKNGTY